MACQIITAVVFISLTAYPLFPSQASEASEQFITQNTTLSNAFVPQPQSFWSDRPFLPNHPSANLALKIATSPLNQFQCSWIDRLALPNDPPSTPPTNHFVITQPTCSWLEHLSTLDLLRAEYSTHSTHRSPNPADVDIMLTFAAAIVAVVIARAILETRISTYKFYCALPRTLISWSITWICSVQLPLPLFWCGTPADLVPLASRTMARLMLYIGFVPSHQYYMALDRVVALKNRSNSLQRSQLQINRAARRLASRQAAKISSLKAQLASPIARETRLVEDKNIAESKIEELERNNVNLANFSHDLFKYIIALGKVLDIAGARLKERAERVRTTTSELRQLLVKVLGVVDYLTLKNDTKATENKKLLARIAALETDLTATKTELAESTKLVSTISQTAQLDADKIEGLHTRLTGTTADLEKESLKHKNSRSLASAHTMIKDRKITELTAEITCLRRTLNNRPAAQAAPVPQAPPTEPAARTTASRLSGAHTENIVIPNTHSEPKTPFHHQRQLSLPSTTEDLHTVTRKAEQALKECRKHANVKALPLSPPCQPERERSATVPWGWTLGVIGSIDAPKTAEAMEDGSEQVENTVLETESLRVAPIVFPSLWAFPQEVRSNLQKDTSSVTSVSDVEQEPVEEIQTEPTSSRSQISEPSTGTPGQEAACEMDRAQNGGPALPTATPPMSPPLTPEGLFSVELGNTNMGRLVAATSVNQSRANESRAPLLSLFGPRVTAASAPSLSDNLPSGIDGRGSASTERPRRSRHNLFSRAIGDAIPQRPASSKVHTNRPTPSGAHSMPSQPPKGMPSPATPSSAARRRQLWTAE